MELWGQKDVQVISHKIDFLYNGVFRVERKIPFDLLKLLNKKWVKTGSSVYNISKKCFKPILGI